MKRILAILGLLLSLFSVLVYLPWFLVFGGHFPFGMAFEYFFYIVPLMGYFSVGYLDRRLEENTKKETKQ